jgi:LCP family protein required for cell wall assembly
MTDEPRGPTPPPRYTKYRAKPTFRKAPSDAGAIPGPRPAKSGRSPASGGTYRPPGAPPAANPGSGPGRRTPGTKKPKKPITAKRVAIWAGAAIGGWLLLSLVLFLISATIQAGDVDTGDELSSAGPMPFATNTILVLGSDARPKNTKEPGGVASGSRADSIMLLRLGGGQSSSLSIPRDTAVDIPGHGLNKINAAYAFGGVPLTIKTVEQYLGIDINHVMLVSFTNFPKLIDAMGGIDYTGGCVRAKVNGGYKNGGVTLKIKKGTTHLDGARALALSRVRHNACKPHEDDFARQQRQQLLISGMKSQVLSIEGFIRLPLISWNIPKALDTDMGGPTLIGMFSALALFGSPDPTTFPEKQVTFITLPDGGSAISIPPEVRRKLVRRFEDG